MMETNYVSKHVSLKLLILQFKQDRIDVLQKSLYFQILTVALKPIQRIYFRLN